MKSIVLTWMTTNQTAGLLGFKVLQVPAVSHIENLLTMKSLIKFLILFLFFSCSNNKETEINNVKIGKKDPKLVLTACLKASYSNFVNSNDKNYYYLVELKLINNATSECEFYTLTCGGLVNVLTDSRQVNFLYDNCSTNFGVVVKLLPNQEYSIPVILLRNKNMQGFRSSVKFGFIISKPKSSVLSKNSSLTNQEIFDELKLLREKQENIIWANPIVLTSTNCSPYEIRNIINETTYSITTKN
jgi:hypothetical protein